MPSTGVEMLLDYICTIMHFLFLTSSTARFIVEILEKLNPII
jgi:hypothetical protein